MATPEAFAEQALGLIITNARSEHEYFVPAVFTPKGTALTHAEVVLDALEKAREDHGRDTFLEDRLSFEPHIDQLRFSGRYLNIIGGAGLTTTIDTGDMQFERGFEARTGKTTGLSVSAAGLFAFIKEVESVTGHARHFLGLMPHTEAPLEPIRTYRSQPSRLEEDFPTEVFTCYSGRLAVNTTERTVLLDNTPRELHFRDFDLLEYLARYPGRVFTRNHLLNNVWGLDLDVTFQAVNASVNRIRRVLGADVIETTRSVGYAAAKHDKNHRKKRVA